MTLFFSHGVFFIAHKIHRIHKSAHVTLVLASGTRTLRHSRQRGRSDSPFVSIRAIRGLINSLFSVAYIAFFLFNVDDNVDDDNHPDGYALRSQSFRYRLRFRFA